MNGFYPIGVIIVKKIISSIFLSTIFICSTSILAMRTDYKSNDDSSSTTSEKKDSRLTPCATLAKSLVSTAVTLGTYAGMSIAFSKIAKIQSFDKRVMCKVAACFAGATISAANFAFLEKHFNKLWQLEPGFVKNFCIGLMVPNILGSVINLASWIIFLGR